MIHAFYIDLLDNKELRNFINMQKLLWGSVILLSGKNESIFEHMH